jgi:hypothetical protein
LFDIRDEPHAGRMNDALRIEQNITFVRSRADCSTRLDEHLVNGIVIVNGDDMFE